MPLFIIASSFIVLFFSLISYFLFFFFFFLMIRRPPRSTLFPSRRSSDLMRCLFAQETFRNKKREVSVDVPGVFEHLVNAYLDRKSTRLNSSHTVISYAVFCLKKKK